MLLEKGPAYQNYIKTIYLWRGVPGTTMEKIILSFLLSAENINYFSWHYKFYDVEEKNIRDCKICSPYNQFMNRSLIFTNKHLNYMVGINEYQKQVTTDFQYKRYLFDFDATYRDKRIFCI